MSEQHENPPIGSEEWRRRLPGEFRFFNVDEVAKILHIGKVSARAKINSGEIMAIKPDRKWLVRQDWLTSYMYQTYGANNVEGDE